MSDQADINRERHVAQLERTGQRPVGASRFSAKVVGVSFVPAYPDNLYVLDQVMHEAAQRQEHLPAILIRNPDNAYDSNAIEVHVPSLGAMGMIGHLTRPIAARLAPEMDAGVRWLARVESVLIAEGHLDNPGISITCARVREEES